MSRIFRLAIGAWFLGACANSMTLSDTAHGAVSPVDVFRSYYEVPGNPKRPWDTRLDFYRGQFAFSQVSSPTGAVGESGGAIRFAENDEVYYAVDLPFFAPKHGASEWTTARFKCASTPSAAGFLINCKSAASGAEYNSLYNRERGLLWFDYFCQSFTDKICRYELRSKTGLFSPAMLRQLRRQ